MEWVDAVVRILHKVADSSVYVGDIAQAVIAFLGGIVAAKKLPKKPEGDKG